MIILNFSHPLTEQHVRRITELVGRAPDDVRAIRSQFDVTIDLTPQIVALVDDLAIDAETWQQGAWLIVLPSLNYAAGVLLAELHGRMGHFPAIVRLRSVPNALVTEFEVAEIINLETVRQAARTRR